jgi:uncharacterized paraquat-inducible protein A
MIRMDISTALFVYLFFTTVLVLVLWAFFDPGNRLRSFNTEEEHIRHCNICSNNYIDNTGEEVSKCPRCGSFNDRVRYASSGSKKRR